MDPQLQALAAQLGASALRNSASLVTERIRAITAKKRDQEAVAELDQIIVDLLADKAEVLRIAQAFQEQLVAQRITEEEVQYIADTVVPLVRQIVESTDGGKEQFEEFMPILEPLISVETVTVLQLFGFNFRQAIGGPLTDLVARKIGAIGSAGSEGVSEAALQLATLENQTEGMRLSQDPVAYERFRSMYRG